MKHIGEDSQTSAPSPVENKRSTDRKAMIVPARLAWKDHRGVDRFASVVTRNVSTEGVFVECQSALAIPLYRLVHFQVEPGVRASQELPEILRHGRILSAVYRATHVGRGGRTGLALRLLVDRRRARMVEQADAARATA